jgi:hypothetical protein
LKRNEAKGRLHGQAACSRRQTHGEQTRTVEMIPLKEGPCYHRQTRSERSRQPSDGVRHTGDPLRHEKDPLCLPGNLGPCRLCPKRGQPDETVSLTEARRGFTTMLIPRRAAKEPVPEPPRHLFRTVRYDSRAGQLAAYLTPDPKDGKKHSAIIWITGGTVTRSTRGAGRKGRRVTTSPPAPSARPVSS